jgi:hypothetical protein
MVEPTTRVIVDIVPSVLYAMVSLPSSGTARPCVSFAIVFISPKKKPQGLLRGAQDGCVVF